MPASNPLIDGPALIYRAGAEAVNPQAGTDNGVNAAGTSEALAAHVAVVIAFALIGVYVLRASGFKFVVAGSVG